MTTKDAEQNMDNDEARDQFLEEGLPIENGGSTGPKVRPSKKAPDTRLSVISQKYDVNNKGHLDEAERKMRELDTSNRGFLTNDKVYGMMLDHMKMQREMFTMKRIIIGLSIFTLVLSLGMLGMAWAAAILAKDSRVEGGNLKAKGGDDILGTRTTGNEYVPKKLSGDRRGLEEFDQTDGLTKLEAKNIYDQCEGSTILRDCGSTEESFSLTFLKCDGKSKTTGSDPVYKFPGSDPELTINCPNGGPSELCEVTFAESCATAARSNTCPAGDISPGGDCSAYAADLQCATGYSCTGVETGSCTCDGETSVWSCNAYAALACTDDLVSVTCADDNSEHWVSRDGHAECGPCNHICQDGSVATQQAPLDGPSAATECPATLPDTGDACSSSSISRCKYNPMCCCENDPAYSFEQMIDCDNDAFGPVALGNSARCAACAEGLEAGGPCDTSAACTGTMKHSDTVCQES